MTYKSIIIIIIIIITRLYSPSTRGTARLKVRENVKILHDKSKHIVEYIVVENIPVTQTHIRIYRIAKMIGVVLRFLWRYIRSMVIKFYVQNNNNNH